MRDGIFSAGFDGVQAREVANQPLTVVEFPVEWCLPVFLFDRFPTFGEPPAEVLITAVAHEIEVFAVSDQSFIDLKVLQEDLVSWFLVVPRKISSLVTQPKESAFDVGHALDF